MEIKVGDPATVCYANDTYAATVESIIYYKNGKIHWVNVQLDRSIPIHTNIHAEPQQYRYERDDHGVIYPAKINKKGQLRTEGGTLIQIGYRRTYYCLEY